MIKNIQISLLFFLAILISSCNNNLQNKEIPVEKEVNELVGTDIDQNAETEAEMKALEEEVMEISKNSNKRSVDRENNRSFNPDDDCALMCGKDGSVSRSEFSECMRQCLADKAKEKEEEKENEQQQNEQKEKEDFLEESKDYFKNCIYNAKTEEAKKNCREIYMHDKENYYNGNY